MFTLQIRSGETGKVVEREQYKTIEELAERMVELVNTDGPDHWKFRVMSANVSSRRED